MSTKEIHYGDGSGDDEGDEYGYGCGEGDGSGHGFMPTEADKVYAGRIEIFIGLPQKKVAPIACQSYGPGMNNALGANPAYRVQPGEDVLDCARRAVHEQAIVGHCGLYMGGVSITELPEGYALAGRVILHGNLYPVYAPTAKEEKKS